MKPDNTEKHAEFKGYNLVGSLAQVLYPSTKRIDPEDAEAHGKALEEANKIKKEIGKKYNISPFLYGSLFTGLNAPGKYDFDYGARVTSKDKYEKLIGQITNSGVFKPSPYNVPETDMFTFKGEINSTPIDLTLFYGDKAKSLRERQAQAAKIVSSRPDFQKKIIGQKAAIKELGEVLPMGKKMVKWWKREVDKKELGLPDVIREPLKKEGSIKDFAHTLLEGTRAAAPDLTYLRAIPGSLLGGAAGAAVGASTDEDNRLRGALKGGLIGLPVGALTATIPGVVHAYGLEKAYHNIASNPPDFKSMVTDPIRKMRQEHDEQGILDILRNPLPADPSLRRAEIKKRDELYMAAERKEKELHKSLLDAYDTAGDTWEANMARANHAITNKTDDIVTPFPSLPMSLATGGLSGYLANRGHKKEPEKTGEPKYASILSPNQVQGLVRKDMFGHRTDNLTAIIGSGAVMSAHDAAKKGLLDNFEAGARGKREKPTEDSNLRTEVFMTKGLLPPDASYGRYGILFRARVANPSRYLNLVPEEHVRPNAVTGKMTFVVPDSEIKDWNKKHPKANFVSESNVPEELKLPSRDYLAPIKRLFSGGLELQKKAPVKNDSA